MTKLAVFAYALCILSPGEAYRVVRQGTSLDKETDDARHAEESNGTQAEHSGLFDKAAASWIQQSKKHCSSHKLLPKYSTRRAAEAACIEVGSQCSGIYDNGCDNKGDWYRCAAGFAFSKSGKSCVYTEVPTSTPLPTEDECGTGYINQGTGAWKNVGRFLKFPKSVRNAQCKAECDRSSSCIAYALYRKDNCWIYKDTLIGWSNQLGNQVGTACKKLVKAAECKVTTYSEAKCRGRNIQTYSTLAVHGQEWKWSSGDQENYPVSASIEGECTKVEFYDEDNNKEGYEDNFVRTFTEKETSVCENFPWDLENDLGGLKVFAKAI